MRFLPVSETDRAEMLRAIGVPPAEDAEVIRKAPHTTPVRRVDEVAAAKNLLLRRRPDSRT